MSRVRATPCIVKNVIQENYKSNAQTRFVYVRTKRNVTKDIRRFGIDPRAQSPFLFCNHAGLIIQLFSIAQSGTQSNHSLKQLFEEHANIDE